MAQAGGGNYTVASGDTLSGIGAKYGVNYMDIAKANGIANPNKINAGQVLKIPGANNPSSQPAAAQSVPSSQPSGSQTPRSDYVSSLISQGQGQDQAYAQQQQQARQALMDYYAKLEDPTARYNRISTEQGVPQQQGIVDSLSKDVMNTQSELDGIPGEVASRSGDFLIDDARRQAITNREEMPVQQILKSQEADKQFESVGLQDKLKTVQNLMTLAEQGDANGAKAYQLGVDYTTADRTAAEKLIHDSITEMSSAYSGDQASADKQNETQQTFSNNVALKELEAGLKTSKGSGGTGSMNKATAAQLTTVQNLAKTSKNPKSDIWNYIHSIEPNAASSGVDTSPLWNVYNAAQDKNPAKQTTKTTSGSTAQLKSALGL